MGRRLADAAVTLILAFLTCFALLHAMPGDPLDRLDSPGVPAEQAERTRRALGLDRPLPEQFLRTLAGYAHGDFGASILLHRPVGSAIAEALPATMLLGGAALLLGYGIGLPLAALCVVLPRRWRRFTARAMLALATIPRFWLGVVLVLVAQTTLRGLPVSHAASPGGGDGLDRLRHLILPALTLGIPALFTVARYQLAVMERALASPHVAAARARGGSGSGFLLRHLVRPSLGPVITLFGLDLPVLVSGAIVVEVLFSWPGVGRLTAQAVLGGDYPLALASALLTSATVLFGRHLSRGLADRWNPPRAGGEWQESRT